jgi:hypothetical protein
MYPKDGSNVGKSPYAHLIYDCLASRWPPTRVYRFLCQHYGPGENHELGSVELWEKYKIPGLRSIQRYFAKWISDKAVLPSSLIDEKLKGVNVRIDALHEMGVLIELSREHLARAIRVEQNIDMPLDSVESAAKAYADLLERYMELLFQLGILKLPEGVLPGGQELGRVTIVIPDNRREDYEPRPGRDGNSVAERARAG